MEEDRRVIDKLFLRHPRSVGETYWQHLRQALTFSGHLAVAAMACLAHALIPACFQTTASRRITHLHDRMVGNRRRTRARRTDKDHVFDYVI